MSEPLTFEEYQRISAETAVYPEVGTGSVLALCYLGLGLGEAGEIQGKLKKILRDDNGVISEEKRQGVLGELGDLLWYVSMLTDELGAGLEDVAEANISKLADRKIRGVLSGSGDNR
jgi:NTP pyrophosphatase (non-canonical NTP hydrolase)